MGELVDKIPYGSLFLICTLLHFIADFNLQGILANFKQKEWWKKNYPQRLYDGDYITSGIIHALSWSILTFLPFCFNTNFMVVVYANAVVHYIIDHLKANRLCISLTLDQMLHVEQIVVTLAILKSL